MYMHTIFGLVAICSLLSKSTTLLGYSFLINAKSSILSSTLRIRSSSSSKSSASAWSVKISHKFE